LPGGSELASRRVRAPSRGALDLRSGAQTLLRLGRLTENRGAPRIQSTDVSRVNAQPGTVEALNVVDRLLGADSLREDSIRGDEHVAAIYAVETVEVDGLGRHLHDGQKVRDVAVQE
jgi:hypothetical protein